MNTVGIFAGRGDVIIAMFFAFVFGMLVMHYTHRIWNWIKRWRGRS